VQVAWLTQGVYYVFADYGVPLLTRLFLLIPVRVGRGNSRSSMA
jgi:hypothetical protein